jgi:hypothetical protein
MLSHRSGQIRLTRRSLLAVKPGGNASPSAGAEHAEQLRRVYARGILVRPGKAGAEAGGDCIGRAGSLALGRKRKLKRDM